MFRADSWRFWTPERMVPFTISGGNSSRFPAYAIFSCISPEPLQSGRTIPPIRPCRFKGVSTHPSIQCSRARRRFGPFWSLPLPSGAAEPAFQLLARELAGSAESSEAATQVPGLRAAVRRWARAPLPTSPCRSLAPPLVSTGNFTLPSAHLSTAVPTAAPCSERLSRLLERAPFLGSVGRRLQDLPDPKTTRDIY